MHALGDKKTMTTRPDFDRSSRIDFQGAKITTDTRFLLMREIDQPFNILSGAASQIDGPRSPRHTDHSLLQGRAEIENRIKGRKNTLRWDKTNLAGRAVCGQSSKAFRRMSFLQSAPHDSGCGILVRERQSVYRLDHQAAFKG
jgi:hypothetical protein